MRNTTRAGAAILLAGLLSLAASPLRAQEAAPKVLHLSLTGVVDPFIAAYIRAGIGDPGGVSAVLLTIDTPGGLDSSMREIIKAIASADVPVVCYVSPQGARAASAGAFILIACPIAAMAPATNVGASTPIGLSGGDLARKVTEDAVAYIRSLAEQRGRNADVAESFVRNATSISAEQALEDGVIDIISPSVADLLTQIDGRTVSVGEGAIVTLRTANAEVVDENMGVAIRFLHSLIDPNLAFLFFWIGLALIVLELIVPGHIFSGTVGTILFALSFVSFGLLPVRLVGVLLLVASVVFFILEVKVPGLGAWSVAGLASLVAGGLLLFDTSGGVRVSPFVIGPTALSMAAFFGFAVTKVLAIRHMPPAQGADRVVGMRGVVIGSGLVPEGIVRVAAEEWRAVSASGDLPGGTRVVVTALNGLVLTVAPVSETEHEAAGASPAAEGGN